MNWTVEKPLFAFVCSLWLFGCGLMSSLAVHVSDTVAAAVLPGCKLGHEYWSAQCPKLQPGKISATPLYERPSFIVLVLRCLQCRPTAAHLPGQSAVTVQQNCHSRRGHRVDRHGHGPAYPAHHETGTTKLHRHHRSASFEHHFGLRPVIFLKNPF